MARDAGFNYDVSLLKRGPNIFGCTNPAATNYNANANVDDGSCIIPVAPPIISVSPIDIPLEASGEYTYMGGSPEKWVSNYDGLAELYYDDVKGYWVLEWSGGGVLKNITDPDNIQPPRFNWVVDGGNLGSNINFAIAYGDDDPTDPLWSGRWYSQLVVSGAGQSNGTYTPIDNAGDNWRQGAPVYYSNSALYSIWAYNDYSSTKDWLLGALDDSVSPIYGCSDDVYFNEGLLVGGTWFTIFGTPPAPTVS